TATSPCAGHNGIERGLINKLGDRDTGNSAVTQYGHHVVAVTSKHHRAHVFHATVGGACQEQGETGAVEHAGHPSDHGRRETSDLLILIHHRIEGIADDDGESIGAVFLRVLCNVSDDGDIDANKIISTLTWLARN